MLVFFALGNAKVLSFVLGNAKLPDASSFVSQWNIGLNHCVYGVYSPHLSTTAVPPMLKCPDYRIRDPVFGYNL